MPPKSIFRQPGAQHFQLVHRSQRDPLIHDPDASKHVLKPIERANAKKVSRTLTNSPTNTDPVLQGQSRSDLESILPPSEVAHDVSANVGEAALYGIYYDDTEYNYMQHLRAVGENEEGVESILIEAPSSSRARKKGKERVEIHDLPQDALASRAELKRTYESQQAIPDSIAGFQPSMDPHLRQALEALEDDAFVDDDLDDDFFGQIVAEGERGSDEECDFSFSDDHEDEAGAFEADKEGEGEKFSWEDQFAQFKQARKETQANSEDEYGSEAEDTVAGLPTLSVIGGKKRRKGASDASGYSMSSSSMYRNEALQTLDERFDQMIIKEYEEEEDTPSSEESYSSDEAPELLTTREDFESMMDDFLVNYEILGRKMKHKLDGETATQKLDTFRRALGKGDDVRVGDLDSDKEDDILMPLDVDDKKDRWDCETILTTYSNLENHPRLIRVRNTKSTAKIHLDPKTGFPKTTEPKKPEAKGPDRAIYLEESAQARQTIARSRDESKEEKKARKSAVKIERQMRRKDKKLFKEQFESEMKTQKRVNGNTEVKVKKLSTR